MGRTVSTEDLKTKLDRKDPIKVVETLAPERYREAEAISQILRIRIRTSRPPFSTRGQVQHVPIPTGHKREDAENDTR
ncbi:MAG: hypothetical protein DMG72_05015 [Acidobacteria bacterium]|nr:MAG: hypothetical protein DMG72_05015 [Acidobacteriota bacterium]